MAKSLSRLEREANVLKELQMNGDSTIQELAAKFEVNYYTIREVVYDLFQQQKIKVTGQQHRTKIYGISDPGADKQTLPYLSNLLSRTHEKIVALLAPVGREDQMTGVYATKRLPKHVVTILHLANQASHGFPVGKDLEKLRAEIQEDYLKTKNVANIYEQILEDVTIWTPKYLKEFVDDPDYHYPDIVKAKEYYDSAPDA